MLTTRATSPAAAPRPSRPRYPSDLTRLVRRRAAREAARTPERTADLEFAAALKALREKAPDDWALRQLNALIWDVEHRIDKPEDHARDLVLRCLEKWDTMSTREIADDCNLTLEEARRALDYLSSAAVDLVEMREGPRGRGGKVFLWSLRETAPKVRLTQTS